MKPCAIDITEKLIQQ